MIARGSIALLALSLLIAPPAQAFVRTTVGTRSDVCLYWVPRSHDWWLFQAPNKPNEIAGLVWNDVQAAMQRAVETWTAVSCSDVSFNYKGPTNRFQIGYVPDASDNINLMIFREETCSGVVASTDPCLQNDSCGDLHNCWSHTDAIIALTTVSFDTTTGQIADADMEFNATKDAAGRLLYRFTDVDGPACSNPPDLSDTHCVSTDVQNTATHESGHFLGLAHTPDMAATMYASAPIGQVSKRMLAEDDTNALCSIYPRGGQTNWCVPPATPKQHCGSAGVDVLGLAALGLMRRRKRVSG